MAAAGRRELRAWRSESARQPGCWRAGVAEVAENNGLPVAATNGVVHREGLPDWPAVSAGLSGKFRSALLIFKVYADPPPEI